MRTLPDSASRALENATRIGVWTWYVDDDLVTGNPELASLFGLDDDDVERGLPLWNFVERIHADDRQSVVELVAESLAVGSFYSAQYRILHAAGEHAVFAVGRCYSADDGERIHVGLVINLSAFFAERSGGEAAFAALDQIAYHCLVAHKLCKAHGLTSLTKTLQYALEEVGTRIAKQIS